MKKILLALVIILMTAQLANAWWGGGIYGGYYPAWDIYGDMWW